MLTFSGYVKFLSYQTHTTRGEGFKSKFCTIRVQDIGTRRVYWLYDWSGSTENARKMEKLQDSILYVGGYLNSSGKLNFAVLQRWGIYREGQHSPVHPETGEDGYMEVLKDDNSGDTSGSRA